MKIIILAGGGGTRLYPLSNPTSPKQFLALANDKPLIINTIERFCRLCRQSDIVLVTGEMYRELTQCCLKKYQYEQVKVVYEPCAKNTAPAIMLGIKYITDILKLNDDEPIFVAPSDHIIKPLNRYLEAVSMALEQAKSGNIATIGIMPSKPEVGFGYILAECSPSNAKKVLAFKEKPDFYTAKKYLKSGNYYWNAGMYAFTPRVFEAELKTHAPSLANFYTKGYNSLIKEFSKIDKISIDYAIAEKSKNIMVVPFLYNWSDIGSWDAYYEFCDKDNNGNVIIGNVKAAGCKNCLLLAKDGTLTANKLQDQIVINAFGNIISLPRGMSQAIKG